MASASLQFFRLQAHTKASQFFCTTQARSWVERGESRRLSAQLSAAFCTSGTWKASPAQTSLRPDSRLRGKQGGKGGKQWGTGRTSKPRQCFHLARPPPPSSSLNRMVTKEILSFWGHNQRNSGAMSAVSAGGVGRGAGTMCDTWD